jgi:endonuclease YncB( thermonuclease family)
MRTLDSVSGTAGSSLRHATPSPRPGTRTLRTARAVHRLGAGVVLSLGLAAFSTKGALADEWLVYIGGGIQPIQGGWSEQRGRVVFTKAGGTLSSVRFEDVDLPASTFITYQLDGRRHVPPRASVEAAPAEAAATPQPCVEARVTRMHSPESLEIAIGDERELVHVACLDTPESKHRFEALGWFGVAAMDAARSVLADGASICVAEHTPPRRDGQDHRIVHVALADGRDFATTIVASGFGLLRPSECRHGVLYRAAEDDAIRARRGLWGENSAPAAFEAARLGAESVAPGSRGAVSGGGCRMR